MATLFPDPQAHGNEAAARDTKLPSADSLAAARRGGAPTAIGVLGAGGRIGRKVLERLAGAGFTTVALVRERSSAAFDPAIEVRKLSEDLAAAPLDGLTHLACCAGPAVLPSLVQAIGERPMRLVGIGSTRRYTRFPDPVQQTLIKAEAAVLARGADSMLLHPTMIYGGDGENNLVRVLALIRRFGVVPLPAGGRSLIQPIHADDVAEAVARAVLLPEIPRPILPLPGPEPIAWAELVRAIAAAAGLSVAVVPVPLPLARLAAAALGLARAGPRISGEELQRLLEDKAFPAAPVRDLLGFTPRSLEAGLRQALAEWGAGAAT